MSNGEARFVEWKILTRRKTCGKFANEKYECSYVRLARRERESGVKVFWTLIFEMESLNDGRVVYYAQ